MIPLLTYPLALLALSALPMLAAIYFFRNRFRRKPVSSIALWQQIAQAKEGGSRLTKFQTPLWFLLELLAIIFIVLAAVDPRWPSAQNTRRVTLILDNSASMSADSASDRSPRDQAIEELKKLLNSGRLSVVRIILAGTEVEVMDMPAQGFDINELEKKWECLSSSTTLNPAVALGLQMSSDSMSVLVLTDCAPTEEIENDRVKWQAFGISAPNIAFVNASRTRGDTSDRCLLEIANFSRESVTAPVTITGIGPDPVTKSISLSPGARRKMVFEVPTNTECVTASLDEDALSIDNRVWLLLPALKLPRVKISIANEDLAECVKKAVDASGLKSVIESEPQIVFTDMPGRIGGNLSTWTVRLIGGDNPQAYTGPFVIDHNHPIAKGVDIGALVWGASRTNQPSGLPVISAGNVPLITDEAGMMESHNIRIQFCPETSTLQRTPVWPSLIWNIMKWRSEHLPGLASVNIRASTPAVLSTGGRIGQVEIQGPNGEPKLQSVSGTKVVLNPDEPGLYQITAGTVEHRIAVNFISPEESDLSQNRSGEWGSLIDRETMQREMRGTSWIFILLTLLILTAHLMAISRGKTSA